MVVEENERTYMTTLTVSDDLQKITTSINQPSIKKLEQLEELLEEPQTAVYIGSVSLEQDSENTDENQVYSTVESDDDEEGDGLPSSTKPKHVYIHWNKRATNESEGLQTEISGKKRFPSLYVTKFGNADDIVAENSKKRLTEISNKIGINTIGEYFQDEESQGIAVIPGFVQYNVSTTNGDIPRRIYFTSYSLKNKGQANYQRKHGGPLFVFVTSPPFCQTLLKPKVVSVFSSAYSERGFVSIIENDTHLVACELTKLGYDCLSVDPVGADNVPSFYCDTLYKRDHAKLLDYLAGSSSSISKERLRILNVRDVIAINTIIKLHLKIPEGAFPLHPTVSKNRKLVIVSNLFSTGISNMIRGSSELARECSGVIGIDLSESCHPFTSDRHVGSFVEQIKDFCEPFSKLMYNSYNPDSKTRENASLDFLKMFSALCVGKRSEMIKKIEKTSSGTGELPEVSPVLLLNPESDEESVPMETESEKSQIVSASSAHSFSSSATETLRTVSMEKGNTPKSQELDTTKVTSYCTFKLLENFHEDDYEITLLSDTIKKLNVGTSSSSQEGKQISSLALKHRDNMFQRNTSKKSEPSRYFNSERLSRLKNMLDVNSPVETKSHVTNIVSGIVSSVNYFFFMNKSCQIIDDCLDRRFFDNLLRDISIIQQTGDNKIQSVSMDTIFSTTNQALANKLIDSSGPQVFFDEYAFTATNTQPETPSREQEVKKLEVFSFTKMDENDALFSGSAFPQFINQLDNYVGFLDCLERPALVAELFKSLVDMKNWKGSNN